MGYTASIDEGSTITTTTTTQQLAFTDIAVPSTSKQASNTHPSHLDLLPESSPYLVTHRYSISQVHHKVFTIVASQVVRHLSAHQLLCSLQELGKGHQCMGVVMFVVDAVLVFPYHDIQPVFFHIGSVRQDC